MTREEALKLIEEKIHNERLKKHLFAVEACMKHLALHFGEDSERWGLAGLLHDIDYEDTYKNPEKHAIIGAEILKERGVEKEIVDAVLAHADKGPRDTLMAKALYSADPLTGLIVASALMHPEKRLKSLDTGFLMRRFKEKGFARGASREQIKACEEMGLSLEEFMEICLKAMKEIDQVLGL